MNIKKVNDKQIQPLHFLQQFKKRGQGKWKGNIYGEYVACVESGELQMDKVIAFFATTTIDKDTVLKRP